MPDLFLISSLNGHFDVEHPSRGRETYRLHSMPPMYYYDQLNDGECINRVDVHWGGCNNKIWDRVAFVASPHN